MTYIIKNIETGKFLSFPGSIKSYTKDISKVRLFPTMKEAEKEKLDNEIIIRL